MWKRSWVVLGIATASLLLRHMILACWFERIREILRMLKISWDILRLLARLCIWPALRGLTSLLLLASWVDLCQILEMFIGRPLKGFCVIWVALRAMEFTTLGIQGYLKGIVTQIGFLMLMRLRPQVVMCLRLVLALFPGSLASRSS